MTDLQVNTDEISNHYLSERDYERFSQLLLDCFGLNFSDNRRSELELAIMQAFATSTINNLEEYFDFIKDEVDGGAELERLVNFATVNETHFFRDAGQFDALSADILPELINRRRSLRTLRLWSAGCASGEEPYSLAILLRELLPDLEDWSITILGTDINTNALDRARRAVYSDWSFREEKAKLLRDKYFHREGNRWELMPEIRRMVTFTRMNLATTEIPSYETNTNFIDLILCRNVLIYLSERVSQHIVSQFFESLQPGGWLVVAPSEGAPDMFKRFHAQSYPSAIMYQRLTLTGTLRMEKTRPRTSYTGPLRSSSAVSPSSPVNLSLPRTTPIARPVQFPPPIPPEEELPLLEQAQDLISYGHSDQAQDILLRLTSSKSLQDKVDVLLGQVYANRGDWDQAEHWCVQAIRLNRLSLDAYYTLALVLQHKGKIDLAIEAMRKVAYLDHSDVLAHFGLANLYFESSQLPKAVKSLDNALHLLENRAAEDLVPRSGGITVSRLRDAIIRQQQHWNALMLNL
jgi:chemotaxis protein methyltransferase CheR